MFEDNRMMKDRVKKYKDKDGKFETTDLKKGCQRFMYMYKSLAGKAKNDWQWRVKPKFHMVQELCEYLVDEIGNPALFWAYRDESFVGFIAELGGSRGGPNNIATTPIRIMDRYRALSKD